MDAKEILSSYLDRKIFIDGCNLSDIDILKCMESYHQAKSKEEAEERYKKAVNFKGDISSAEKLVKLFDKQLRIASGKEEEG